MNGEAMIPLRAAEIALAAILVDNGVRGQARIDRELEVFRMSVAGFQDRSEDPTLPPQILPPPLKDES